LDNVGSKWCVHAQVVTRRSWGWGRQDQGRMVAWARAAGEGETKGQNRGCSHVAGAGGARRGTSSACGRGMPLCEGFLRGSVRFCGSVEDFQGVEGPHGWADSATPWCAG
jgi:hypothetical protein